MISRQIRHCLSPVPHTRPTLPKMFTNPTVDVNVIDMGYNDSVFVFSIDLGILDYLQNVQHAFLSISFQARKLKFALFYFIHTLNFSRCLIEKRRSCRISNILLLTQLKCLIFYMISGFHSKVCELFVSLWPTVCHPENSVVIKFTSRMYM